MDGTRPRPGYVNFPSTVSSNKEVDAHPSFRVRLGRSNRQRPGIKGISRRARVNHDRDSNLSLWLLSRYAQEGSGAYGQLRLVP